MKTMFGKRYPNCVKKEETRRGKILVHGDPCWDTETSWYEKKKTKMVPNCVPKTRRWVLKKMTMTSR